MFVPFPTSLPHNLPVISYVILFELKFSSNVGIHSPSNICKIMQFLYNDNTSILNYALKPTCPVSALLLIYGNSAFTPHS